MKPKKRTIALLSLGLAAALLVLLRMGFLRGASSDVSASGQAPGRASSLQITPGETCRVISGLVSFSGSPLIAAACVRPGEGYYTALSYTDGAPGGDAETSAISSGAESLGERAPGRPPGDELRAGNPAFGGEADEVFVWTHKDIDDIARIRQAYDNSPGASSSISISITRYYGLTKPDHTLQDHVAHLVEARLVICSWDLDPGEAVRVQINRDLFPGRVPTIYPTGADGAWSCQSYPLKPEWLRFPLSPGAPSNPATPDGRPGSPDPAYNTLTIHYPADGKALIYGMRLIVRGVRPVVLVPGFSANANSYCWGQAPRPDDTCKGEFTNTLLDYGLIVIRPCHHQDFVVEGASELGAEVYDFDYTGDAKPIVTRLSAVHKRCFEAVVGPPNKGSVATNVQALRWTLAEIRTRYGVQKTNLVGHSKGGLIGQQYASSTLYYAQDVENLVCISCPQRGVYLADVANGLKRLPPESLECILHREMGEGLIRQLGGAVLRVDDVTTYEVTESWLEKLDAFRRPAPRVNYHSVVATAGRPGAPGELDVENRWRLANPLPEIVLKQALPAAYCLNYRLASPYNRGESDIFVPAPSQRIGKINGEWRRAETSCSAIRANHDESSRSRTAALAVVQALGVAVDSPDLLDCEGVADPAPGDQPVAAAASSTSPSLSFAGSMTYGQSATVSFVVDGSNLKVAGLWDGEGRVALTLTDPLGRPLTPAAARPDHVGYEEIRYPPFNFGYSAYAITSPVKGTWTAHILAPDSGPAPESIGWQLAISQRSAISFSLHLSPGVYLLGTPVTLQARGVTGTLPMTGASIQVEIVGPGGLTHSLSLHDDGFHSDLAAGDGIYGAQFIPPGPGFYAVSASITGALPAGITYMRQAQASFSVLPIAQFSDVYGNTPFLPYPNAPISTTHYPLPTTHYPLPNTQYPIPNTQYPIPRPS